MNKAGLTGLAGLAACAGLALLLVKTDREFINLTPTEGRVSAVVLESGHTYAQIFPSSRDTSISRVGLFLRPAAAQLASGKVTITVESEGARVREELPSSFIDGEGPTQVRFTPPIPTSGGAEVRITLQVPVELSGQIRVQTRELDETFNPDYAQFHVDGALQPTPLAYQVYYTEHPALALQAGGLFLTAALLLLIGKPLHTRTSLIILSIALPLLYFLPELFYPRSEFPAFHLILIQIAAFLGMALFLHRRRLHPSAILLGATLFAFSTWWALHFATHWQWQWEILGQGANLKDIFLNPNQVTAAHGGNWEHYGSYLGIIGAAMAFLGVAATLHDKTYLQYLALTLVSPFLAILFPDTIILTTFGLAFFAAQGLVALRTFLGTDKLITTLMYIIALLVLLDVYTIGTRVLEYGRY